MIIVVVLQNNCSSSWSVEYFCYGLAGPYHFAQEWWPFSSGNLPKPEPTLIIYFYQRNLVKIIFSMDGNFLWTGSALLRSSCCKSFDFVQRYSFIKIYLHKKLNDRCMHCTPQIKAGNSDLVTEVKILPGFAHIGKSAGYILATLGFNSEVLVKIRRWWKVCVLFTTQSRRGLLLKFEE